jgi:malate dehydrogenase (oxaloacetate-decarboxylating)
MAIAVARELAGFAEARSIHDDDILPRMDEWEVFPRVAATAAMTAQAQGLARVTRSREDVHAEAARVMQQARDATALLMRAGLIPEPPAP